jgi:hypothetical protein
MSAEAKITDLKKNGGILFYSLEHSDADFKRLQLHDATGKITIVDRTGPEGRLEDKFQAPNEFTTKIKFFPPVGNYMMIYGTDELVKCGYFMQPKIIQPFDSTDVKVTLVKYVDCQDLELPFEGGLEGVIMNCNYCHYRRGGGVVNDKGEVKPAAAQKPGLALIHQQMPFKKQTVEFFG